MWVARASGYTRKVGRGRGWGALWSHLRRYYSGPLWPHCGRPLSPSHPKMTAFSATIKNLNLDAVTRFLAEHEQPFEQCAPASTSPVRRNLTRQMCTRRSQLYSANSETKFVDESLRRSRFRAIVDEQLFCLCDELVEAVNQQAGKHGHFSLVRSDATQIEYRKGSAPTLYSLQP